MWYEVKYNNDTFSCAIEMKDWEEAFVFLHCYIENFTSLQLLN